MESADGEPGAAYEAAGGKGGMVVVAKVDHDVLQLGGKTSHDVLTGLPILTRLDFIPQIRAVTLLSGD